MIKAIFVDFYGTLIYEDEKQIREVSQRIFETGNAQSLKEIGEFWWEQFKRMCDNASGINFRTQRELEYISLKNTIERYGSSENPEELSEILFEYWIKPDIFSETKEFFKKVTVPIYIVSNIDTDDINKALNHLELHPNGVFTSEDTKSYKPNKEIFELALNETGLKPNEIIHIGDSLSSDIEGARNAGIDCRWINRGNKRKIEGVKQIHSLLDVIKETDREKSEQ